MQIRTAQPDDAAALVTLCKAHAAYEQAQYSEKGQLTRWVSLLAAPNRTMQCLVVEVRGKLVGYATFFPQFSTWDMAHYLYLDCLYLHREQRGQGIGRQLMDQINAYAQANGYADIQWQTPHFNEGAIRFYNRLGAISKTKQRYTWAVGSTAMP